MTKRSRNILFPLFAAAMAACLFFACNPNKNNASTRNYQAFLTRYNIQYNGDKHYKETLEDMEKSYQDNYDAILMVHPAEARANTEMPQPQGDFTRSIEKAQKAIQLHSIKKTPRGRVRTAEDREWKNRAEYNPFLHNSWMLMGKALYMQGDFGKASTIFMYVSRHFRWLPQTVAQAKIWEARCYCALGWLYEAQQILDDIDYDKLTDSDSRRQYWIALSSLAVRQQDYPRAAAALEKAIGVSSGAQKTRLRYLLGQVYARMGENQKAFKLFSKIAGGINTDFRTRMSARIEMSQVVPPDEIDKELGRLRKLTRYESNKEYLDRIYFAMGNLYFAKKDTAEAIKVYQKSVELSQGSGLATAQSQLAIGLIYFNKGEYDKAQPHYSAAASLLPDNYPDIEQIKRRSDILDRYAVYARNVQLQDSLLTLARMSADERMAVCEKLAEAYREEQKKLKQQQEREEFLANSQGSELAQRMNTPQPTVATPADQDAAWYFYNPQIVSNGRRQFQQTWGNRRPEDNWRRRDKTSVISEDFPEENYDEDDENSSRTDSVGATSPEELAASSDPANAQYYLKDIPLTEEQQQQANEIIMEGLYNMAVILQNDLRDFPRAIATYIRLLDRYPDNIYRLDVYDNLFLIYSVTGNKADAEKYRLLVVNDFPDSPQGIAMRRPDYFDRLKRQQEIQDSLYLSAYDAYMRNDNAVVHRIVEDMRQDYSTSSLMPKFMFLDAMAYATDGDREKFRDGLRLLLERYPETDLTPVASGMMNNLNSGRQLGENRGNMRGTLFDVRISGENGESDAPVYASGDSASIFTFNPDARHLYVFVFPTEEVNANKLLYDIGRHNFETFMARDFDLEQINAGPVSLLIVSGLNNRAEALRYGRLLDASATLAIPPQVARLIISEDDFKALRSQGMSLGSYTRQAEGELYKAAQKEALDENLYEIEELY